MSDPLAPDPPRLEAEGGPTAQLLRRAELEASERQLNERAMFRRVEHKRKQRFFALHACGALLAAAAVALVVDRTVDRPRSFAPDIQAEALAAPRATAPVPVLVPQPEPLVSPAPSPPSESLGSRLERNPVTRRGSARRIIPAPERAAPAAAMSAPATASAESCRTLSQEGRTQPAIDCFRELARENGLESDLALYEAARLSSAQTSDAARTLDLLDEHERRFPQSALRIEASWLRVQALRAQGRSSEALAASERLLGSQRDGALAAEIHWLRARIHSDDRQDCESALSDLVALMGQSGARSDEAEWRRAQCLDRLGRTTEALSAYRQYLRRAQPRNRGSAEERVAALAP